MFFSNAEPENRHPNHLSTSLCPYKNPTPFTSYSLISSPPPALGEINSHFVLLLFSPICLFQTFHTMESYVIWLVRCHSEYFIDTDTFGPHSIPKSEFTTPLVQTLWSNNHSGSAPPFSLLSRDSPNCCSIHTDWLISKWWPQKTERSEETCTWLEVTSQLPDFINHCHPKTRDRDRDSDQNTTLWKI